MSSKNYLFIANSKFAVVAEVSTFSSKGQESIPDRCANIVFNHD
jgi:hypothetical protein